MFWVWVIWTAIELHGFCSCVQYLCSPLVIEASKCFLNGNFQPWSLEDRINLSISSIILYFSTASSPNRKDTVASTTITDIERKWLAFIGIWAFKTPELLWLWVWTRNAVGQTCTDGSKSDFIHISVRLSLLHPNDGFLCYKVDTDSLELTLR